MTYGEMNLIFLVLAGLAAWILKSRYQCFTNTFLLLPMLVLTAAFDNLIIVMGIVQYDVSKLIGLYVGTVPIEDFAYTVVAVLLVPAIWKAASK
jgi:lycopene cyclase domain-containing protein